MHGRKINSALYFGWPYSTEPYGRVVDLWHRPFPTWHNAQAKRAWLKAAYFSTFVAGGCEREDFNKPRPFALPNYRLIKKP